ncbi:MAG: DUF3105 domain-containing protein [Dehalococcoidia bacterium]|nr:DUF3105 domain-containing protein [Dehalococcoidia bacterium]
MMKMRYLVILLSLVLSGMGAASCAGNKPGEVFPDQGAQHIPDNQPFTNYNSVPPTSGPHWGAPAGWGISSSPILNERQVHNLEHGGVMIQYSAADTELVRKLVQFAQKQENFPCFINLAPYPNMPYKIAVTAWGVRDTMDSFDEARLQKFVDTYMSKGPEHGIRCTV